MVIVFMLFGAVGFAYEIMSVLSAIWWAIGIFAIPIGVIVICIKKLKIALGYSDEQGERANCIYIPIYLVAGVTSVLFSNLVLQLCQKSMLINRFGGDRYVL